MIATFELTQEEKGGSTRIYFIKLLRVLGDFSIKEAKVFADRVANDLKPGEKRTVKLRINQTQNDKLKYELKAGTNFNGVELLSVESEELDFDEIRGTEFYVFRAPEFREQLEKLKQIVAAMDQVSQNILASPEAAQIRSLGHDILNVRDAFNRTAIAPPVEFQAQKQTA